MPCPTCGGVTRVTDTRPQKGERLALRRRRICQSCSGRFFTIETPQAELDPTHARIRYQLDFMSRYLMLPEAGQKAVRSLMSAFASATPDKPETGTPPFADGGVLAAGKTYLVGERA